MPSLIAAALARGLLIAVPLALAGCELWGAPLPDPECADMPVAAERELLATGAWLRGDPRALNGSGGPLRFGAQLSGHDPRALFALVGERGQPATETRFRLLALVNRTDLAEQLAPESPAGEARLVYTLTSGLGDDPASLPEPFTVIFEYSLGSLESVGDWARAFHALRDADDAVALVTRITQRSAISSGPRLSRVRVNDARSGVSELYELAVDGHGALAVSGLRNTPRSELAGTPELSAFLRENAAAISVGEHHVPSAWLATSAGVRAVPWLPSEPRLERDFSRATCGGCHGDEGPGQAGFHLHEVTGGDVAQSSFLMEEELPRRTRVFRQRLCAP